MSLQLSFLFPFGIDLYGKKANIFHVFNQHCNQIEKNVTFVAQKAGSYVPVPIIFLQNIFINI